MQNYRLILIIGIIEVLIGAVTLLSTFTSVLFGFNAKTANVLYFVIIAASMSTLIGVGILRFSRLAYNLLLYFSSVIIITKILFLLDILQLNGQLQTIVPSQLNNFISFSYHGAIIYFLKKDGMKDIFHR